MFPWYNGYKIGNSLPEDDCIGIQQLYGTKEKQWAPYNPGKHHHTHYHKTTCRPSTPRTQTERPRTRPTQPRHTRPHHPNDRHPNEVDGKIDDIPDTCDTSYDAITMYRGELFIFKGKVSFFFNFCSLDLVFLGQGGCNCLFSRGRPYLISVPFYLNVGTQAHH